MNTPLDMPEGVCRTLPEWELTNYGYERCWAASGTLEFAVDDALLAANPINRVDPTGLNGVRSPTPQGPQFLLKDPADSDYNYKGVPTVTSNATITKVNGKQVVKVTVRKAAGYSSADRATGVNRFLSIMEGTIRMDIDSAQVVAVSGDGAGNGNLLASDNFSNPAYRPVAGRTQGADWNAIGEDAVEYTLPILDCAKTVNVVLVYTDIIDGASDAPGLLGVWNFESADGNHWQMAQPFKVNDFPVPTVTFGGPTVASAGVVPGILQYETHGMYVLPHRSIPKPSNDSGFDIVRVAP